MIIKSHIRGGYRAAADYLKEQGKNEEIRLVEISDPDAQNLDEAFHNMWTIACNSRAIKPLHHISINPYKDERLTDEQVLQIVKHCEEKYGYKPDDHQRVIVEHVKEGRQHFHVIWNRVSLTTGKVQKSGEHWKKSKQVCREMERELGLKVPGGKQVARTHIHKGQAANSKGQSLLDVDTFMPNTERSNKSKTGKGEGAGGGASSIMSALKIYKKEVVASTRASHRSDTAQGPNRRKKNVWVPVERRQKPN